VARLLASIGQYICSTSEDAVHVHLYAASRAKCTVGGKDVEIRQETNYPWSETVRIVVTPESTCRFTLSLRMPGWCRKALFKVNGNSVKPAMHRGYAKITRTWKKGDEVLVAFSMPVERVEANPAVRMNCGKIALQRGPVVYCLEEADNGKYLADMVLPKSSRLAAEWKPGLLGGCVVIRGKARRRVIAGWDDKLYGSSRSATRTADLVAVPYSLWANRAPGEMLVWIREC